MDTIIEIIKNLVFGAIAISVIEIVLPENNLKKYFNYTGGLIFLAIMIGSFYNLYVSRDKVLTSINFQNDVAKNMERINEKFNKEFEKNKTSFMEKSIKESISHDIKNYIETKYGKKEVVVETNLSLQKDLQGFKINSIKLNNIQKEVLDYGFYKFLKENFNVDKEVITINRVEEGGQIKDEY